MYSQLSMCLTRLNAPCRTRRRLGLESRGIAWPHDFRGTPKGMTNTTLLDSRITLFSITAMHDSVVSLRPSTRAEGWRRPMFGSSARTILSLLFGQTQASF